MTLDEARKLIASAPWHPATWIQDTRKNPWVIVPPGKAQVRVLKTLLQS